ncbi:GntR family transcriptional regulator [Leucobacter chromiireducens]|uniref:GntR family transcriptional regulator n=1 Tax=Leucobacter chromiireducens TaxID=283877 RepID=UPI0013DDCDC2|nr:GntR family transcriptional regulator [Leucobacter chromiireducens]
MLEINPASSVPIHGQLISGILEAIEHGDLKPGDRLPTVRRLAADIEAAPGTVARAYGILEERGVLATQGRRGTFVRQQLPAREVQAREAAEAYLALLVDQLGYSQKEAIQHLVRIADRHPHQPRVSEQ